MKKKKRVLLGFLYLFLLVGLFGRVPTTAQAQEWEAESSLVEDVDMKEWNNRIRREKFDLILPQIMRERDVDMWIHVMRIAIPDQFGAEELGSTSGFFVFTDRGGDRIERAILGTSLGSYTARKGRAGDVG